MRLRKRDPNALDAPMSPAELVAARETLGHTPAQFADDVQVTLYELEEMEAGRKKIPELVAVLARAHVAERRSMDALAASGLPECDEGKRLAERMVEASGALLDDDAWTETEAAEVARVAFEVHTKSCALCIARREYSERHLPPMPELKLGPFVRLTGALFTLGDRLPGPLRVPKGIRGTGRRMGIGVAGFLSAFVALIPFAVMIVGALVRGRFLMAGQGVALWLGVTAGYFSGFYLAGWAWDLTRRIAHRFAGYVLRGVLLPAAIYGVIGVMMSAFDDDYRLADVPSFLLFIVPFGATVGAVLWVWHRIRGKLPSPARTAGS